MTNKEAQEVIKYIPNLIDKSLLGFCVSGEDVLKALDFAIKALEANDKDILDYEALKLAIEALEAPTYEEGYNRGYAEGLSEGVDL